LDHPEAAKERQAIVLELMVRHGFLSPEEAQAAYDEDLDSQFKTPSDVLRAPHWVFYVRGLLERKYGRDRTYRGGLQVYTTLDLEMQEQAQKIVADHVAQLRANNANNAALVAIRPSTGEILAMVGSKDYYDLSIKGQVNVANSERQPGSSFKPFSYVTAFMKGYNP